MTSFPWFKSMRDLSITRPAVRRPIRRPTDSGWKSLSPGRVPAVAGSLDPTFGIGGKALTDFTAILSPTIMRRNPGAVAVQTDGKIVVAGSSDQGGNFAVARYNADGSLDSSFGTGGKQTIDFGSSYDEGYGVAVQADGKIVVVGASYVGPPATTSRWPG